MRYGKRVHASVRRPSRVPRAPRAWREQMLQAGVAPSIRRRAWVVMSAALSWAARSQAVPEIQTNGCLLANERTISRRRSARRDGTGYAPATRRGPLPRWALSPQAVEAIREQMLLRVGQRKPILAHRDAMIVSLQYGLAARNQEVWALRWMSLIGGFAWVTDVLTSGHLEEWGKTEHSTGRRTALPSILREDLTQWRAALRSWGHPARDIDFIIPGNLTGVHHGVREPETGACHLSEQQAKTWRQRYFTPAVKKAAEQPELTRILGATLCTTPRRHLAAPAHRGPTNRRERVRNESADAQPALCVRHRGPPPPRATTRRR